MSKKLTLVMLDVSGNPQQTFEFNPNYEPAETDVVWEQIVPTVHEEAANDAVDRFVEMVIGKPEKVGMNAIVNGKPARIVIRGPYGEGQEPGGKEIND